LQAAGQTGELVIHKQEVYKTIDTFRLKVDIFYTKQTFEKSNNTAIVFFHGGGWAYGTPSEFFTTCERYAKMGIVTFSVDYRLSIDNGIIPSKKISPIECLMDAKSAMRWVRKNAERLHINKNKIIASGQSAGGHLALSTAMIDLYNEKTDNLSISCKPDAVILFSACVNTVEGWCDMLLADRRTKIWSISPFHNVKKGMPPMIEFHGTDDEQVPKWTLQFFTDQMAKQGNYFEQHMFEGRKHYLGGGNQKYSRYYDDDILKTTDEFLKKFKFLN
jgi:dipeptidyl aminopeptidase/acylaminoacyl peptidase